MKKSTSSTTTTLTIKPAAVPRSGATPGGADARVWEMEDYEFTETENPSKAKQARDRVVSLYYPPYKSYKPGAQMV